MKNKKVKKKSVKIKKYREKVNFGKVKKPPKKKSKKHQRLKINLPFEEALKVAFTPIKLVPIKK